MSFANDQLIEQLAAGQLGLVTRAQLRARGITSEAIASRVRVRRLHLLHRGVYSVGPVVPRYARELAAVLACGPHAVLSHRSAAFLWDILPDPGDDHPVDVSLRRGDCGHRPGMSVYRLSLPPDDTTTRRNIAVTTPSRTLFDLAVVLSGRDLEIAIATAERLKLVDRRALSSLTGRHAGRRGVGALRALLTNETGPAYTRSVAEERFLAAIRNAQLPAPESNARVGGYEVDFYWRRERLVVEIDGSAFHMSERSFENDRLRDARLAAGGVHVIRVTWRQLTGEPEAMLVRLAQILTRAGGDRL